MESSLTMPAITHVAGTVSDITVSEPWYTRLFGVEPVLDEDTGPFRHVVYSIGNTLFGLHTFPELNEVTAFDERRPGLDHVAFGCRSRDELVQWAERLDSLGVDHGDVVDAHYGSGLSFRDADNIALEMFARRRDGVPPRDRAGWRTPSGPCRVGDEVLRSSGRRGQVSG